ncbi:MAG TPA: DUF4136 domain-containing protein [Ohtaekwangia sp.]
MKKYISIIGLVALLSWSCEQEPEDIRLLDDLVVSTNYDPQTLGDGAPDYLTYAIPTDTIGFVTNTDPNDTIRVYSTSFPYPRLVIDAVRQNMESDGFEYQRVDVDDDPDIGVNVYVVTNLNLFQQVVYPNYYSGYYGYGGYYYYPYVQTYAYNTATLIVELIDLKNRSGNQVKVIWNAYMGDVINSVDYEQQSVDAIHQAFLQSPYLKRVP